MDEKLKAVSATGENAEKDEALLECIKEVWNLMGNRIQSLEDKEINIQSSLASSICRLNNDESQIKLCENKQMVPQIVLQDDFKPLKNNTTPEPVKPKSLAEYVHNSVQNSLKLVDQKQICVEMHSEMTDEILKVFEDVNPYLIRDLPPLIGSNAFETGNFAKHHTKNVVSPIDDVIIELPQPIIPRNIPNTAINGTPFNMVPPVPPPPPLSVSTTIQPSSLIHQHPLPSPKLVTPKIQEDITAGVTSSITKEPVIITPSPVSSVKSNGNVKNADNLSQKSQISNDAEIDRTTVTTAPIFIRGPPNLADIIKNAPPIVKNDEPRKKQNLSLFDDEEEEEPFAKPALVKPLPPAPRKQIPLVSKSNADEVESTKTSIPQSKPRTVLPTPQPQAPPRKTNFTTTTSPASTVKISPQKKHKSLFSSSDEEDDVPINRKPKIHENVNISKDIPSSSTSKPIAPKRELIVNNANNIPTPVSTPPVTKNDSKVIPRKPKNLFDDSDEDDDFFTKPQLKPVAAKAIPKPLPTQRPVTNKVVRKSMFSSSESD